MGKEKAEIASLVEKYGRVQLLMKYVKGDMLKNSQRNQPKGKAVGTDWITKKEGHGENLEENIKICQAEWSSFAISLIQCVEFIYQKEMEKCVALYSVI